MSNTILIYVISIISLIYSPAAFSQQKAECSTQHPLTTKTINLLGNPIFIGPNTPIGSVIYKGIVSSTGDSVTSAVGCRIRNEPILLRYVTKVISANSNGDLNGIYNTNLNGVGVRIFNYLNSSDLSTPVSSTPVLLREASYPTASGGCSSFNYNCRISSGQSFRFELIKTGDISPGVILGSSFPIIGTYVDSSSENVSIVGSGQIISLVFSGQLTINSGTCSTPPNYTVDLGEHKYSDIKSAEATEWVDSSIRLTGCPNFSGSPTNTSDTFFGHSTPTFTSRVSNILQVSIQPINPIRVGVDGAFSTDVNSSSGKGLDIQISKGSVLNNTPLKFNEPYNYKVPLDSSGDVIIPMSARYIKNGEDLTPGNMNGKVTYLLEYN